MKQACAVVVLAVILGVTLGCGVSGAKPTADDPVNQVEPTADDTANHVELDGSDNGSQVELEVGQVMAITLETNPTTGYRWIVAELDDAILRQKGSPLYEPLGPEEEDGVGGLGTFRFEAVGVGQATLELAYQGAPDEEPEITFSVQVVVR
jgi:inhibitor of cysteine peptidase